jgi:hypothetical protein
MASAMFQISEASLGGEPREKLVRGRTKNWMEAARDLGKRLHKNCSQARCAGADYSEFGRTTLSRVVQHYARSANHSVK